MPVSCHPDTQRVNRDLQVVPLDKIIGDKHWAKIDLVFIVIGSKFSNLNYSRNGS